MALLFISAQGFAADPMVRLGGAFRPFDFKKDQKPIVIKKFLLDAYPVSVGDYSLFLQKNPEWRRGSVPSIKADLGYLKDFGSERTQPQSVMTQVSWFAARAYCKTQGKRLPTLYEWEFAATRNQWDKKPSVNRRILAWFSQPNHGAEKALVGSGLASPQGVHDLHGLIWEWVEDFNSSTVTGDARADTSGETNLFCGATALTGSDLADYATYMRYGMRSSLRGSYTGNNLGFRCAKDIR